MWPRPILLKPEKGAFVQLTCRWFKNISHYFQVILRIDIEMKND